MITMFISPNDLCASCNPNFTQGDPDVWIQDVTEALDYLITLHTNSPRTFVNVVQNYCSGRHYSLIKKRGLVVGYLVWGFVLVYREQFTRFNEQYREKVEALIASG